jgi:hypothetical protein
MLDRLLHFGIYALIGVGILAARYEGACWAYRKAGQSWWGIMRPDRLLRPDLYEPEGDRLRRIALKLYVVWLGVAVVFVIGLLVRG